MRRDRWIGCLWGAALSFALSLSGMLCLSSAFSLGADTGRLLLGCAVAAVIFSIGFSLKWWYIPVLLAAPVAGYLWFSGSLPESLQWLVYQISRSYDMAYGTGVLYWSSQPPAAGDVTVALCVLGSLIAFVGAWTVCRRKPAIWSVILSVLPLAACFVVTDRVPRPAYLYLLLSGIGILLLSSLTRRQDLRKGNRLTALVTLPVALALLVLFLATPQSDYQGQKGADALLLTVQQWVQDVGTGTGAAGTGGVEQTVALDQTGRLVQTHTPVMTVHAEGTNGTVYLRQQGFQMYDGTSWHNEHGNDIYQWVRWEQLQKTGMIQITTRSQHLMKFVPYYAKEQLRSSQGALSYEQVGVNPLGITENAQGVYDYAFCLYRLSEDAPSSGTESPGGLQFPVGSYSPDAISLPADTVTWAEAVVAPLIAEHHTVKAQAEAIGDYVRSLGSYSRNTPRMPAGETDFARWFVEEAETGYCVHYATTAAVLLRAAGIQAQYVEGYTVRVTDGQAVTVYGDQAHAWVEYYDPEVGWRILEATPPEGVPGYINASQGGELPQSQTPQLPQQTPEQSPQQQAPETQKTPVSPILWWVLGVVAAAALVWMQRQLRLRLKKRRLTKAHANQQAVLLWRELAKLSRLLKRRPAQQWHSLAQKAKFSQHVLTAQELEILQSAVEALQKQLKEKSWYLQPIYALVFAIY